MKAFWPAVLLLIASTKSILQSALPNLTVLGSFQSLSIISAGAPPTNLQKTLSLIDATKQLITTFNLDIGNSISSACKISSQVYLVGGTITSVDSVPVSNVFSIDLSLHSINALSGGIPLPVSQLICSSNGLIYAIAGNQLYQYQSSIWSAIISSAISSFATNAVAVVFDTTYAGGPDLTAIRNNQSLTIPIGRSVGVVTLLYAFLDCLAVVSTDPTNVLKSNLSILNTTTSTWKIGMGMDASPSTLSFNPITNALRVFGNFQNVYTLGQTTSTSLAEFSLDSSKWVAVQESMSRIPDFSIVVGTIVMDYGGGSVQALQSPRIAVYNMSDLISLPSPPFNDFVAAVWDPVLLQLYVATTVSLQLLVENTWSMPPFTISGSINALLYASCRIFIGGTFQNWTSSTTIQVGGFAIYDLQRGDGVVVPNLVNRDGAATVTSMVIGSIGLIVAGTFTTAGTVACVSLCVLDMNSLTWSAHFQGIPGHVSVIALLDSLLLIGGDLGGSYLLSHDDTTITIYNAASPVLKLATGISTFYSLSNNLQKWVIGQSTGIALPYEGVVGIFDGIGDSVVLSGKIGSGSIALGVYEPVGNILTPLLSSDGIVTLLVPLLSDEGEMILPKYPLWTSWAITFVTVSVMFGICVYLCRKHGIGLVMSFELFRKPTVVIVQDIEKDDQEIEEEEITRFSLDSFVVQCRGSQGQANSISNAQGGPEVDREEIRYSEYSTYSIIEVSVPLRPVKNPRRVSAAVDINF